MTRRVAVVGAGWAGLAAAIEATAAGCRVDLHEMAPQAGGRARRVDGRHTGEPALDNGQHIAIGAYRATLGLLAAICVAEGDVFDRRPLALVDPDGAGLVLGAGRTDLAFVRAVLARRGWRLGERLALVRAALGWRAAGFRAADGTTVAALVAQLPARVRRDVIEPLCVAALNTPADAASARVFLRVLGDAFTGGPGSADLLLPRVDLGAALPDPALAWLRARGARVQLASRVQSVEPAACGGWRVRLDSGSEPCDSVVVATSAVEAARLVAPIDAAWAGQAERIGYEPIVTVYAASAGCRLPQPMLQLASDDARPAQFVFDRGALGGPAGLLAFVVSGARAWVDRGIAATDAAVLAQARAQLARHLGAPLAHVRTIVEKRATFRCVPDLARPRAAIAPGLVAAGDYVDGPYPATLEGAVRSGVAAARAPRDEPATAAA